MNKIFNLVISISLLLIGIDSCWAMGPDYKCKIERLIVASGDTGNSYEIYKELYLGKEFTVDRRSGVMVGELKNTYVTRPQVIDFGSTENSYKVVTTMKTEQGTGAGSNIYALNIDEFVSGSKKPFVFMENNKVFLGFCEHY